MPLFSTHHWYRGFMRHDFLKFEEGDTVYIHYVNMKEPLKMGDVILVVSPDFQKVTRLHESIFFSTVRMWPNNRNPLQAPTSKADQLTEKYREHLRLHPPMKKLSEAERRKLHGAHFLSCVSTQGA